MQRMGRKEERRDNKREIKEEGIGGYGERRGTGAPPPSDLRPDLLPCVNRKIGSNSISRL